MINYEESQPDSRSLWQRKNKLTHVGGHYGFLIGFQSSASNILQAGKFATFQLLPNTVRMAYFNSTPLPFAGAFLCHFKNHWLLILSCTYNSIYSPSF